MAWGAARCKALLGAANVQLAVRAVLSKGEVLTYGESMISIARTTNRNVTHWQDGQMVLRWTAAGMLNAQRSFRRVKGYKQMPQLVAALRRHTHPDTARRYETVGAAA